jgi:hypothetical protein
MSNAKPKPEGITTGAREFFTEELKSVMQKRNISAAPQSFEYLVDLMTRFLQSDTFFTKNAEGKLEDNVLAQIYAQYVQGTPEVKQIMLRRLGDVCLMVTGFFADSLKRKVVDVDYYCGMGGAAYWQLSCAPTAGAGKPVYKELSVRFKTFSDVLGEMSERSGLQSNGDLLRLYEKWLYTGSDRLKNLLSEHGIQTPVALDTKTRH